MANRRGRGGFQRGSQRRTPNVEWSSVQVSQTTVAAASTKSLAGGLVSSVALDATLLRMRLLLTVKSD